MEINPLQGYFVVHTSLKKHAGWKLYVVIFLFCLTGLLDGLGISLLLPILQGSDIQTHDESNLIIEFFEFIGLTSRELSFIVFIIGSVFILKAGVRFSNGYINAAIARSLLKKMKGDLVFHYISLDYLFFQSRSTGHFTNIINQQVDRAIYLFSVFGRFNSQFMTGLMYVLFAFLIDWSLALISISFGIIAILFLKQLSNYTKKLSRKSVMETTELNKFLLQIMAGYKYLKSTYGFAHLEKKTSQSINEIVGLDFRSRIAYSITESISEPFTVWVVLFLILIYSVIMGNPLAPLFVSILLFYRSMNSLLLAQQTWQEAMNYYGGFEQVDKELLVVSKQHELLGEVSIKAFHQEIKFENVRFHYESRKVFENLSLNIQKNQTIGIVGPSGSGKSTFLDLCTHIVKPSRGKILIDGIDSVDINSNQWRQLIGFVSQDTIIFNDTIKNNITLWSENIDEDWLEKVTKDSYCLDFINELPNGFETLLGENGISLSGGQKQRISIARELYKKPHLLIFDEATSSLDSESECYIQKSLEELSGKITMIIIAHRISTLKNVDIIYILKDGVIQDSGTFDELLSRDTWLNKMAAIQDLT